MGEILQFYKKIKLNRDVYYAHLEIFNNSFGRRLRIFKALTHTTM